MFVCFKLITSNCQDKFLGQNQKDFNQCRENILFIVLNYSLTCVMTFFIIKYLGGGFEHRLVIFLFFFGLIWLLQWRRGDLNLEVLEMSRSVNQLNYKVLGMYNYFILYIFFYIRNSCITIYCRKRSISKCSKYVSYGLGHSGNSIIILQGVKKNIYYIKSKTKYNWNISTSQKKQKKKLQYIKFYNCFLRDFLF